MAGNRILFGGLQKGALDLDLDTEKISRDLATVIQALVILAVAAQPYVEGRIKIWRERRILLRAERIRGHS